MDKHIRKLIEEAKSKPERKFRAQSQAERDILRRTREGKERAKDRKAKLVKRNSFAAQSKAEKDKIREHKLRENYRALGIKPKMSFEDHFQREMDKLNLKYPTPEGGE
jgi:hypothetical protein